MPTSLGSSITPRSQLAEKPRLGAFAHRGFQNRLFKPKSTNGCYLAAQANQISARDHKACLAERLGHRVPRLRVQRPKIAHASAGELFLQQRHVGIPAAAEILRARAARDSAVGQHETGLIAVGEQLVLHGPILAALKSRLENSGWIEPDHALTPG